MNVKVINILDMVESIGEDSTKLLLDDFSTKKSDTDEPLNADIEVFLKRDAIQFAKEKKSVTYLVHDKDDGSLLGYFTIAHKPIEVMPVGLSNTVKKKVERYAQLHKELNAYIISAFLIAQFGKNYRVDDGERISGNDLMKLVDDELDDLQHRIGGGMKYLDCEADAKLIKFYQNEQTFKLFGERISEKDGKRYLQYMKFF